MSCLLMSCIRETLRLVTQKYYLELRLQEKELARLRKGKLDLLDGIFRKTYMRLGLQHPLPLVRLGDPFPPLWSVHTLWMSPTLTVGTNFNYL